MMQRLEWLDLLIQAMDDSRCVAILGPRQVGKTTLARDYASMATDFNPDANYFDLEDPGAIDRLENPMFALGSLTGLVIIDEVQRRPELFPVLRVLIDRPDQPARFLILGSASGELLRQSSESLAGRIAYLELTPFSLEEVGTEHQDKIWTRGGYPPSYLAKSSESSVVWRENYLRTHLERDLPALGFDLSPLVLRRFWTMLAHNHGQTFNASEIGGSIGVSHHTARKYFDLLTQTFMARQLSPWFENIKKRQVKSPKLYLRDSGLLHRLLGIDSEEALRSHPKVGASWEGFALEEVLRRTRTGPDACAFWAIHNQAELDLFLPYYRQRVGFEFKLSVPSRTTNSMVVARDTLGLDHLYVVHAGTSRYRLGQGIEAISLPELLAELKP